MIINAWCQVMANILHQSLVALSGGTMGTSPGESLTMPSFLNDLSFQKNITRALNLF